MKNKDIITVLEITEKYLKIAQSAWIKKERELALLKIEALPKGIDDKALSHKISSLFKAKNIRKSQQVILSLPRYLVTTRNIKVPSREPAEIEKIISLQASKYLPYPSEELIPSYYFIGQDREGYSQILLIIVHRDVINRYLRIAKDCGLEVSMILVSSWGLYNWYLSYQASQEVSGPVVVVDIDSPYQDLLIVSEEKLIFTRSFSVEPRAQDPDSINLWQNKIVEEIARSITAYQKDNIDKNPIKIILTGSPKIISGLEKRISNALSLPVEVISSLEKISFKDKASWEDKDFSFSSLIGLALGTQPESLSLMPKEIKEKKETLSKRKEWLKTLILFFAVLLILILGVAKNLYDKAQYLSTLKGQINKVHPEANSLEEIKKRLEIVREQVGIPVSSIDALYELYRIAPSQITLNSFSFDENNQVVIKGQAQDLSDVFKFVTTLEKSDYFQGVSVKSATKRKTPSAEVADFEIICPLTNRR